MEFNLGAFPSDSLMFASYSRLFEAGKNVAIIMIPSLIMVRALWTMFQNNRAEEHVQIIKDAFFAMLLMAGYLLFLRLLLKLPNEISTLFSNQGTYSLKVTDQESPILNDIVNYTTIICFWISAVVYVLIVTVVSALAAYLITFGTMLRSYWVIKATVWCLVIASSWPIIWYALNMAIKNLSQEDGFVNGIIITVLNLVKALSPLLASAMVLKSPAKSAAVGTAKAVGTIAGGVAGAGGLAVSKLGGQPLLDQFASKSQAASSAMNSTLGKTIPTIGAVSKGIGVGLGNGLASVAPEAIKRGASSIGSVGSKAAGFFKDKKDLYNGKTIPSSSPFDRSIREAKRMLSRESGTFNRRRQFLALPAPNRIYAPEKLARHDTTSSNMQDGFNAPTPAIQVPPPVVPKADSVQYSETQQVPASKLELKKMPKPLLIRKGVK